MKKTISVLLVVVLLFALAVPSFAAAAGINTYEKKLLEYCQTKYKTGDVTITVPAAFFTAAENYLNTIDLTEAQYNSIIAILDEAYVYVTANKLDDMSDITDVAIQAKLLGYADRALAVVGLTLTADKASNTLTIKNASGATVAQLTPSIIKKTGVDYSAAIASGIAAVTLIACAGAFGVKRFRKEDNEA